MDWSIKTCLVTHLYLDQKNIRPPISENDHNALMRMNMINHNENWTSTGKDVRSAWGKLEDLFKIVLNPESE